MPCVCVPAALQKMLEFHQAQTSALAAERRHADPPAQSSNCETTRDNVPGSALRRAHENIQSEASFVRAVQCHMQSELLEATSRAREAENAAQSLDRERCDQAGAAAALLVRREYKRAERVRTCMRAVTILLGQMTMRLNDK